MPIIGTSQPHAAAGPAFTDALTSDIAVRMTAPAAPRTPPGAYDAQLGWHDRSEHADCGLGEHRYSRWR